MPLFRRLPIPAGAKTPRRRRCPVRRAVAAVCAWVQAEFSFVLRTLEPIAPEIPPDDAFDFPERRVISARQAEPVKTRAPASIFAMAGMLRSARPARPAFAVSAPAALPAVAVERREGVTRIVGAMYPAGRWTPEKEEAERIRRAKQRPPKPTAAAKTRGKKVREWDGEASE